MPKAKSLHDIISPQEFELLGKDNMYGSGAIQLLDSDNVSRKVNRKEIQKLAHAALLAYVNWQRDSNLFNYGPFEEAVEAWRKARE